MSRTWGGPNRRLVRGLVCLAMVVAAIGATVWAFRGPIENEPFMGDEAVWIPSGNYYLDLILRGDFRNASWIANELETGGNFNPHVGKVLLAMGIRLHPNRAAGDSAYMSVYNWSKRVEWNRAAGRMPNAGLLIRGRESAEVFVVGCVLLLLAAGTLIRGELVGALTVALVLASSQIKSLLALAVTDAHYNFFILAGLLGSLGLVRAPRTAAFVGYSALVGLSAGLACSVKITGLPLVAFYYCLVLLVVWRMRGISLCTTVYGPLAALGAALVVVYALNPFFWPFETPGMVLEFPRLYERTWRAFHDMPNHTWGEPPDRFGGIHRYLFQSNFSAFGLEPMAFAVGLGVCAWSLVKGLRTRRVEWPALLAVYFLAQYVFIVLLIQFNWARYYLPTVFAMKLVAAMGIAAPVYWAWGRVRGQARDGESDSATAAGEATTSL